MQTHFLLPIVWIGTIWWKYQDLVIRDAEIDFFLFCLFGVVFKISSELYMFGEVGYGG